MLTVEQLRSKLKKSKTANKEAKKNQAQQGLEIEKLTALSEQGKKLQEQQSLEIEKLKEAIANAMANLGNEREAKQEIMKERYIECSLSASIWKGGSHWTSVSMHDGAI